MINSPRHNLTLPFTTGLIAQWHHDRNLVNGSDDKAQFTKLVQEVAELSDSFNKGRSIKDDIGDVYVLLVNFAERHHLTLEECVKHAWLDIKDRRGVMRDGVFIKEADL